MDPSAPQLLVPKLLQIPKTVATQVPNQPFMLIDEVLADAGKPLYFNLGQLLHQQS